MIPNPFGPFHNVGRAFLCKETKNERAPPGKMTICEANLTTYARIISKKL